MRDRLLQLLLYSLFLFACTVWAVTTIALAFFFVLWPLKHP